MTCAFVRLWLVAAFGFAAILLGTSAAGASQCPVAVSNLAPMPDGKHYGVMLQSMVQGAADIRLTLYSETATYAVTVPNVVFDRRLADLPDGESRQRPFASAPAFIALPQPDALDAARSEIAVASAKACAPRYWYTVALEQRLNPKYVESADAVSEDQILAQLYLRAPSAEASRIDQTKAPECEEPYARPKRTQLARPFYPETLVNHATGTAVVGVDLSPAGAVENVSIIRTTGNHFLDLAALKSAAGSIYSPGYFRCQPIASRYLFTIKLP